MFVIAQVNTVTEYQTRGPTDSVLVFIHIITVHYSFVAIGITSVFRTLASCEAKGIR